MYAFLPAGLVMKHSINANQLRRWMTQHHRSGTTRALPAVLPVTVAAASAPAQCPRTAAIVEARVAVIEIELAGAIVRVPAGADFQHLRLVVQVLRS